MSHSLRTLLLLFYLSVSATLVCIVSWITLEYSKTSLSAGSTSEPVNTAPKNKIQFSENEFLKISQTPGITFILSEARNVSHKEIHCLAKNIYHEARGEGLAGMVGVAQITINRVDIQHRGKKTLCEVVHDPNQFSWTTNKKGKVLDKSSWQQSLYIAQLVILGIRIKEIDDSIYFYSNKIKPPKWTKHFPFNNQIGQHKYHSNPTDNRPFKGTI